ncbi:MAG: Holliday junction resolvase RuvX [Bacteroidales bacterium]|nr:Holliday junction resolvase RuvX [Bacteroidales bacterium]
MGRIMAIDYGQKRVGVAVTDPLQLIATKLDTVPSGRIWDFLADYFGREEVERLVVGYPRQMNNEPSDSVRFIDPFIVRFRKLYPAMPVELEDERFTSKIAFQTMIAGGLKKKARQNKAMVDAVSAVIILQSYMSRTKM